MNTKCFFFLIAYFFSTKISVSQTLQENNKYEANTIYYVRYKGGDVDQKLNKWNAFEVREEMVIHYFLKHGQEVQDHGRILKRTTDTLKIEKTKGGFTDLKGFVYVLEMVNGDSRRYTFLFDSSSTGKFFMVLYDSYYNATTDYDTVGYFTKEE